MALLGASLTLPGCPSLPESIASASDTDTTESANSSGTVGASATSTSSADPPTTGHAPTGTDPGPAVCGDGIVHPDEACDDGNDVPDDGCDGQCTRSGAVEWTYTHDGAASDDDRALAVVIDGAGRIVIVGLESVTASDYDMMITVLGPDGEELWTRTYPGTAGRHNVFSSVAVDHDGDIYAGGYEFTDKDSSAAALRRVDKDGHELWSFIEAGPAADVSLIEDLLLHDGALYSVGHEGLGDEGRQLAVRRHDLGTGDTVWKTTTQAGATIAQGNGIAVSGTDLFIVGQAADDLSRPLTAIVTTAGGLLSSTVDSRALGGWLDVAAVGDSLIVAGWQKNDPAAETDLVVRRLGPAHAEVWSHVYDHDFLVDVATDVAVGPGEELFVSGYVQQTQQFANAYAARLHGDGTLAWQAFHDAEVHLDDVGEGAAFGDGFVVIAGSETVLGQGANVWVRRFRAE